MGNSSTSVLIIGAGQAGLAAAYYLGLQHMDYIIVDTHSEIGQAWKIRYASLVLFSPRSYSELPGLRFPGHPDSYPTKDETADYLLAYTQQFGIHVRLDTKVVSLIQREGQFIAALHNGSTIEAQSVIIATGPFQSPYIPSNSGQAAATGIVQLHSSAYCDPSQIPKGICAVIGAGNSGAQIACELATTNPNNIKVIISSTRKPKFMPHTLLGKSVFWWFSKLHIYDLFTVNTSIGRKIKKLPEPIMGEELKPLIKAGIVIHKPRLIHIEGNLIQFEDNTQQEVSSIVWATGFRSDYSWILIPNTIDIATGAPIHRRGISPITGLYYLGLPWQWKRTSALLGGVAEDARYIVLSLRNR
jgi:putative flavoprotein involved in K+ transport